MTTAAVVAMARVLLLALLVALYVATNRVASSLHSDKSARSGDPVHGATISVEERLNKALDCPEPFEQVGSACYYFEDEHLMNWDDARAYCQGLDPSADLAVLNDCYEFEVVWNYILVNDGHDIRWIGGSDRYQEGSWHWVTGTPVPLGTPFWYPYKPDGAGECLCLSSPQGYFYDYYCSYPERFICQILY